MVPPFTVSLSRTVILISKLSDMALMVSMEEMDTFESSVPLRYMWSKSPWIGLNRREKHHENKYIRHRGKSPYDGSPPARLGGKDKGCCLLDARPYPIPTCGG